MLATALTISTNQTFAQSPEPAPARQQAVRDLAGRPAFREALATAGGVLGSQRLDHGDLMELTSVGRCGRVDAVANVLLADVAEDVVPTLEEAFLVSP